MIKLTNKKNKTAFTRVFAIKLLLVILFQVGFPTYTFALSGGPSQPEVESFTPVGTSDMVDVFSGDFSYNIPLLDVDGYPINIAYKSGVGMDQEASWVGLGWNVNPGVINRSMRGIPDDFKGDQITHKINLKANQTFGLNVGANFELFGLKFLGLGYSVGVKYNTYNGIGVEQSLDISISSGNSSKGSLSGNLGLTSSSDNGLSVNPSISYSAKVGKQGHKDTKLGATIGASFNARGGLSALTVSGSISKDLKGDKPRKGHAASNANGHVSSSFNFGMPTFTPMVNHDMHNFSISGNFRFGVSLIGTHTAVSIDGYYSTQNLSAHSRTNSAYGYLHSEAGQIDDNAIMDFNRENDGPVLKTTPALALPNYTYDIYSISGQGAGGSYRASRNDIGYVYDPRHETVSGGASLQLELGEGDLLHDGFQIGVTYATNKSGRWNTDNRAADRLKFGNHTQGALSENYTFREANEKSVDSDPSYITSSGDFDPVMAKLNKQSKFDIIADNYFVKSNGTTTVPINGPVVRHARQKRDDVMTTLTRDELKKGLGIERAHPNSYNSQPHHIAEITNLGEDGKRYVYGVAAYNTTQEEVTFAVGKALTSGSGNAVDYSKGLVAYNPGIDDSESNSLGIDNYYSNTIMPGFAHSYLLTSILSADYVDIDTVRGPSDADLGTYVKFYNNKYNGNYQWRTPMGGYGKVNFSEGLKTDPTDDKGNFVCGKKELWYLDSIVTKNYVAIFHTSSRDDGHGAAKDGTPDNTPQSEMRKLDGISLYSKADYRANHANAVPVKEVHFVYDYTLCPNITNNSTIGAGKLTLTQIYFTYQNSNKAKFSSYEFQYNGLNPSYDVKAYDRWGNYKPNTGADFTPTGTGNLPTAEFPYVTQDSVTAKSYSSAWHLTDILIPSGGSIHVNYESDDYAYVQNKPAMQMFKIVGTDGDCPGIYNNLSSTYNPSSNVQSISDPGKLNREIYIEMDPNYTNPNDYISGIDLMYFRCLMQFDPSVTVTTEYDYVPGYANIDGATYIPTYSVTGKPAIRLKLKPVSMKDIGSESYNPITKAACQYGRLNLPKYVWNAPGIDPNASFGVSVLNAIINADFTKNITQAIEGPNNAIWDSQKAQRLVTGKSWVRLNNPSHRKFGGGVRVQNLKMNDAWDGMTNGVEKKFSYGQEYGYKLNDGKTSSGVASYEPQIGGDENPWKKPKFYDIKHVLAPDEEHYMEEPFGECFFPSPSVGYSRVTVRNLHYTYVTNHATGKVVHEFYTAKDYPTIATNTGVLPLPEKTSPFSLSSLFKIDTREYLTATEGFYVELNDMHGKPSKQSVYQQNNDTSAISSVEYVYQSNNYLAGNFRLDNNATIIDPKGNVSQANLGIFYDMIGDMRESKDETYALNVNVNLDDFFIILDIAVPMILPSFSNEKTQFRSAVYTKKVERFGLLQKTIAKDLGSTVTTENLAYDSETGQVLLTQTQNDYNDPEYSFTMPAHWYYEGMGQAYKNIGSNQINLTLDGSGTASLTNADQYFFPGDEVGIYSGAIKKGWVLSVTPTSVTMADKQGNAITGSQSVKVFRSGRKNLSTKPIETVTTLTNPLNNIKSNVFANVLQTSAVEYVEGWRTACDCFHDTLILPSTNPYVLGTKGFWKLIRSHTFLTDRVKHNYDNNTDIRVDGVFNAYTPFYALNGNTWTIDDRNWTFVSEVTEYSPFTQELENRDALGRYSAATFGYNQTLATSVGANTKYRELGVDNFEDYNFSVCADNHFRFSQSYPSISNAQSHTGKNSIKVSPTNEASIFKQLVPDCEPTGCNLQITTGTTAGTTTVNTTNGTAPYTMDYDIISGNPSITFPGGVMTITGAPYKISLTVVDKNGCNAIKTIVKSISN